MNKKLWWLGIACLIVGIFGLVNLKNQKEPLVDDYEAFLLHHPYYNRISINQKDLKAIPKADRPDLAWEQEFLKTMDPVLKYPTPEVLRSTQVQMKAFFDKQQEKGIPGSNAYPWIERGPANVGGRTRALLWDPTDVSGKKVWAGGVTGGLWFNDDITNSNSAWQHVDDFWENISITCIAVSPIAPDTMYVGTGEGWGARSSKGAGIWKSTDKGVTWNQIPSTANLAYINDIVVRQEGGTAVVYAASSRLNYTGLTSGSNGLYRSTDGITFNEVFPSTADVASVKIAADNSLWAGTRNGKVYQSIDGTTWVQKHSITARRVAIAVAPSNANVVYALYEDGNKVEAIYKTIDGGDNWTQLTEPADVDNGIPDDDFSRGQAWYDLVIAVDPNDENKVIVGGVDLFISNDGGTNWDHLSKWSNNNNLSGLSCSLVHADQHAVLFKPGSSSEVIFGNDGGVFFTSSLETATNSNVIRSRNKDYNVTQFYACALNPTAGSNNALAGAQDNGTQKYTTAGFGNTSQATGGDGGYCFIDQDDPSIQITSYVYNNYYLSTNSGNSFFTTLIGQDNGSFINPADYDDRENILFSNLNKDSFYRVSGIGGTRSTDQVSANLGSVATNIKVSPYAGLDSTTLFVGTAAGRVYKIENANIVATANPIRIESGLSSGSVSSIEFGQSEDEIMVTYSNYGVVSVWYTNDGGTNWKNKEGNLPNMPVRWGLINPNDNNEAILATELGVWATYDFQNANPIWEPSNKGLANVRIDMLQVRASDNVAVAATFGRGLFESDGFNNPTLALNALFSADETNVNVGDPVVFTNESTGDPIGWNWSFPGGIPSSFVGQNPPSVRYDLPGCYDVSLIVNDNTRDTSRTKSCYINVGLFDGACVPVTSSGTVDGDYINGVQLGTINNMNTGAQNGPYYNNYTSQYASLELGSSYAITLYSGTSGPNDFIVWIDYNGDKILQDPEERIGLKTLDANSSGSINFTVPTTITDGYRLMRIKAVYNSTANTSPCSDNEWGEVEDYGVVFIDNINPPNVDFTGDKNLISVGEAVNLSDLSSASPTSWNWDLADGIPSTSPDQHPNNIIYNNPGCKSISLEATNGVGSGNKTIPCLVEVVEPPVPLFSASDTVIEVGDRISFTDLSLNNPDAWEWLFDGATVATSNVQFPQSIKYNNAGCFAVTLTASYKGISREALVKTCYITVVEPMVTDFTASKTVINIGESINFIDLSSGDPTAWEWQFEGADTPMSTDQSPTGITYNSTGCFKVSLKPSREGIQGSNLERTCYIEVVNQAVADFIASTTNTRIGESVNFFDVSQGSVNAWQWTFAGSLTPTSNQRFPTIVFDTVGCFEVSLQVFYNGAASLPEIKSCYINVDYGISISEHLNSTLSIFPTPADHYVIITGVTKEHDLKVINLKGQEITIDVIQMNDGKIKLHTSTLNNGVYFIKFLNGSKINTEKIIIQH